MNLDAATSAILLRDPSENSSRMATSAWTTTDDPEPFLTALAIVRLLVG